jgi:hypothetical protein
VTPDAQACPQEPQFASSDCRSAPPEHVPNAVHDPFALHVRVARPLLQVPHACVADPPQGHAPFTQLVPEAQALLHEPQCALSVCRFAPPLHAPNAPHVPFARHDRLSTPVLQVPQAWVAEPVLQGQAPAVHVEPAAQALPQAPQLALSFCRSAPPTHAPQALHVPFAVQERVCLPRLHVPHACVSVWSGPQTPPHTPEEQVRFAGQAAPQAPQLALSD